MSAKPQQETLDFGRHYRVADGAREMYRAMNAAVDLSGGITPAAGACGVDRADLRRALDRDGRRVAVEHALAIAAQAPLEQRYQIARAFAETLGFTIAIDQPTMTDAERAARLDAALLALGPLGQQARDAALGGRR